LLLTACGDGGSSSSSTSTSEINTLNLYFTKNEIRSFNSVTGENTWRANYNEGENTLLTLNTDNDKQGHELVVYIDDKTIYAMDYVDAKKTPIATVLDPEICLFSRVVASQESFEGSTKGDRTLVDQTSIIVIPQESGICNKDANPVNQIDFTLANEESNVEITVTEINSAQFRGDTLLDFSYTPPSTNSDDDEDNNPGRYGFLGYDNNGKQLNLFDSENKTLWQTSLTDIEAIPTTQQVTKSDVLIQSDGNLYLQDIATLFDIATTEGSSPPSIPTESKVAALFESPLHTLSKTSEDNLQIASNGEIFALVDDGEVFLYLEVSKEFKSITPKDNSVLELELQMTDNGTLLLLRTFADSQTLVHINTTSYTSNSITQGNKISFHSQGNNVYFNTLTQTGWQSAWLNENFERTTYDNSIFIFAKNSRSATSEKNILLISPVSAYVLNDEQISPKLYEFDEANTTTGRKQKDSKDFVFGEFSVDIREVSNSEVVNDIFGRLNLKSTRSINELDTNVIETYYFNPSETESFQEGEANSGLQLIDFKEETI